MPVLALMAVATAASAYSQKKNAAIMADRNNKEAMRAAGEEHNALEINKVREEENYINAEANIDVARMQARSEAIVAAAASGTYGLSVDDSIMDIDRNAAKAQHNAREGLLDNITNLEQAGKGVDAKARSRMQTVAKPSAFRELATASISAYGQKRLADYRSK